MLRKQTLDSWTWRDKISVVEIIKKIQMDKTHFVDTILWLRYLINEEIKAIAGYKNQRKSCTEASFIERSYVIQKTQCF